MKEAELRKHAVCTVCSKKIGEAGVPMFWVVKVQRHGINLAEMKRQDGLAAFLGSPMLAGVMGTDAEMTMPLMEELTLTVCERCCTEHLCVMHLADLGERAKAKCSQPE